MLGEDDKNWIKNEICDIKSIMWIFLMIIVILLQTCSIASDVNEIKDKVSEIERTLK